MGLLSNQIGIPFLVAVSVFILQSCVLNNPAEASDIFNNQEHNRMTEINSIQKNGRTNAASAAYIPNYTQQGQILGDPLAYYPVEQSPRRAVGDMYIDERVRVNEPIYPGYLSGTPGMRRVPETVLQMMRRGAVEDFSVQKYQRNEHVSSLFVNYTVLIYIIRTKRAKFETSKAFFSNWVRIKKLQRA